jgi:hypothetical protein
MEVRLVVSSGKIQYSSHQILHFRCCKCRDAKPFAQTEDLEHDPFPFVRACSQGSTARSGRLPWGDPRLPGEREDSAQGTVVFSFTVKTG